MKYLFSFIALAFFIAPAAQAATTIELLAQLNSIEARLLELQATVVTVTDNEAAPAGVVAGIDSETDETEIDLQTLTITIEDDSTLSNEVANKAAAMEICESVAYDTDYMWKLITCDFAGETLYSDVFIAG